MTQPAFVWMTLLSILVTGAANADEVVRTVDGRSIVLKSDGTYSELNGLGPAMLAIAVATAASYATDKGKILVCLEKEPDGPDKMRDYFSQGEGKARSSWLKTGGTEEEWAQIENALKQSSAVATPDCVAVIDGWARMERPTWPLSLRSPFKELDQ